MAYFKVNDLTVRYGRIAAVQKVSFCIEKGSSLAVCGINGAGKTSLFSALAGLCASDGGIFLEGRDIGSCKPFERVRAGISLVPEGRHVFPFLSVRENLLIGGYTQKPAIIKTQLQVMHAAFPILREKENLAAGYLSGGQQQILAIARAMMAKPSVLLIDEPVMGLAPVMCEEIYRILKSLRAQGITVLFSGQDLEKAAAIADDFLVLKTGQTEYYGAAAQALQRIVLV